MEIVDNDKILLTIYKYEELVSTLTSAFKELDFLKKELENKDNLLQEQYKIIEILKNIIKKEPKN